MRDFREYETSITDRQINSGKIIFKKQLNGAEGKNIEIDGVRAKGIVLNHLNDMSTTKDQRGLNIELETNIKKGSYVKDLSDEKIYLVLSEIDSHYSYKTCTMEHCNQTLNWLGLDEPIPCWCDNSSYGTKGVIDTNYLNKVDGKIVYYVQYNEKTKQIKQDMRFLFNHDEKYVYQVVDVNNVVTGNILRLVMDKGEFDPINDDIVNNIAYNKWIVTGDEPTGTENKEYLIKAYTGAYEIHKYDSNVFTICNLEDIEDSETWEIKIDYNSNSEDVVVVEEATSNSIMLRNDGYIGVEIILNFTKGDITVSQTVRLVK